MNRLFFKILLRKRTGNGTRSRQNYLKHREAARELVHERLEHFNRHYGLSYGRVSIKDLRTKWGSCSSRRNLNFSYRILLLPPELQDYLVVHELCHLKEMNHGENFWKLVAETVPDPKLRNRELRAHRAVIY